MSDKRLTTGSAGGRRHDQGSSSSHVTQHKSAVKPAGTAPARLATGFTLAIAVIAGVSAPGVAAADEVPVAFIRDLGNQAVGVIRSDLPLASKAAYFGQMIHQDFNLTGISQFELGPYWRMASPAERQEFCDLFADHLIRFYGRQLAQSGGGNFIVTGSRSVPAGVIVTSEIIRQSGSPIPLDWRLEVSDGHYKIEDVTIDGVSMELAQHSEIATIIGRNGGEIGPLLATMRQES